MQPDSCKVLSIISVGDRTAVGKEFLQHAHLDEGALIFDVRHNMSKHRLGIVSHYQNGLHRNTQRVVIGSPGFESTISTLMSNLCDFRTEVIETYEFPSTLVTKCNQGLHRSDTASRMVQSICNTMVDGTGKRIFNANYWALSEASTSAMARQMVEDSKTWIEDPWTVIRGAASVEEMYGYNAVVNDHNAFVVHCGIVQTLTRLCPMVFQRGAQPPSSSSRIDTSIATLRSPTHQVEDRDLPPWKKQRVSRIYDSAPVGWQKDWENCRGDPTKMPARLAEDR